jgi:hypothetical protein
MLLLCKASKYDLWLILLPVWFKPGFFPGEKAVRACAKCKNVCNYISLHGVERDTFTFFTAHKLIILKLQR